MTRSLDQNRLDDVDAVDKMRFFPRPIAYRPTIAYRPIGVLEF